MRKSHPRAKLTAYDVRIIRQLEGLVTHAKLAEIFDVSSTCISGIMNHVTWRDLEDNPKPKKPIKRTTRYTDEHRIYPRPIKGVMRLQCTHCKKIDDEDGSLQGTICKSINNSVSLPSSGWDKYLN